MSASSRRPACSILAASLIPRSPFAAPQIKGINYTVQRATDVAAWEDGSSYGPATDNPLTVPTDEVSRDGTPLETIVVQDNTSRQSGVRSFLHVKVTLQ